MNARLSDEEIARYYDGELSPEEALRVERQLPDDPAAEGVLGGLEQLGDVVRAWADVRGRDESGIADQVMARIASEDAGKGQVVSLPQRPPARHLGRVAVLVGGALSLAAAVTLVVRSGDPVRPAERPNRVALALPTTPSAAPEDVPPPSDEPEDSPAAAIESVDFGAHAGSIFVVGGTEGAVPVVWLLDDASDTRMQPL
jgi:anti-sigma factor RsiW